MYDLQGSEGVINGNSIDSPARAAIELDLTPVRSHITALRAKSVRLAAELLATLDPFERTLTQAIDGPDRDTASQEFTDAIASGGTFEDTAPAVLQLSDADSAAALGVLDLSSNHFGAPTPVGVAT